MSTRLGFSGLVASAFLALAPLTAPAEQGGYEIPTYTATYEVRYKGKRVGRSELTVTHDKELGLYHFRSETMARGLLRLLRPNPVVERSNFRVTEGRICPLDFWYEDGSRHGEDNVHVAFDWRHRVATTTGEDGTSEVALEPGVLDQGSLRVALMRDMASATRPDTYKLVDGDSIKRYEYHSNGEQMLQTPLGKLQTETFVQQRVGSSRRTLLWVAPQLRYLPVRIEQQKDGETTTAMILRSVDGLGAEP
jgi:hypothetical protein